MRKILITIDNNTLTFKERKKLNAEYKNIINTNVISCNELLFSDEYILTNGRIVSLFIEELSKNFSIDTVIIEDISFALMIIEILEGNKYVSSLIIKSDESLTFKICEALTKTSIKNVNCYALQPFMIEYLDKYNVLVESRNEILYLSKFMLENNLNQFSSLFYKMTLRINFPMTTQDEEDFVALSKINKYLRTINVNSVNKDDLEFIVNTLKKANKKNVKIVIRDNISDIETINYLRDFNKKKSKKYKIYFKLVYSNEYLKENLMKQTNSSLLQVCGTLILIIITFSFGYVFYDNYQSMQRVNDIKENISIVIAENDTSDIIEEIKEKLDIEEEEEKPTYNEDIVSLFNINPETVGWIKVNNTNIDYPIVQTINNEYYLKHNFNLEKDNNGWVFMDYRNDPVNISDNTILYAHNRFYSGIMFGTLQNTMRYSWYTNEENRIISFKTMFETYEYEVFSIYKIATTSDYIKTVFADEDEKLELFNILKDRSIYDFKVELSGSDKILTLSTCADEFNRYVMHAVLRNNKTE